MSQGHSLKIIIIDVLLLGGPKEEFEVLKLHFIHSFHW